MQGVQKQPGDGRRRHRARRAPDGRALKVLRQELHRERSRGTGFEVAWTHARAHALAVDPSWSKALTWSRDEWQSCYERRRAGAAGGAVGVLDPAA